MVIIYIQSGFFQNISATEAYILKRDILVIALFAMFSSNKFIWQHHVPVNEIYMFSVPHLKVVAVT